MKADTVATLLQFSVRTAGREEEHVMWGGLNRETLFDSFKLLKGMSPSVVLLNSKTAQDLRLLGEAWSGLTKAGAFCEAHGAQWVVVNCCDWLPDDVILLFADYEQLVDALIGNFVLGTYKKSLKDLVCRVRFSQECPTKEEKK